MSDAYKCDRCGEYDDRPPTATVVITNSQDGIPVRGDPYPPEQTAEFCESCSRRFNRFLRREKVEATRYTDLDRSAMALDTHSVHRIAEVDDQEGKGPGWRSDDYDPLYHFDQIDHNTEMARRAFEGDDPATLLKELADVWNHAKMAYLKAVGGDRDEPQPCGEYHPLPCGLDVACPETQEGDDGA